MHTSVIEIPQPQLTGACIQISPLCQTLSPLPTTTTALFLPPHEHMSTRIKDAGMAIRHSRGYIISTLQGLQMGLREWTWCVPTAKNMLILPVSERNVFVIEKSVRDVKQDEKHVPDLLEAIMRPPGLVKEELRPILSQ